MLESDPLLSPQALLPTLRPRRQLIASQLDIAPAAFDPSTGTLGVVASELLRLFLRLLKPASHYLVQENVEDVEDADTDGHGQYALPKAQLWAVMLLLFIGTFLAALDMTVVTTLMPMILLDLKAVKNILWIATAYLLSCAGFQPLFGKLLDIFGRKPLLILCNGFFSVGCLMLTTSNLWMLVFARFITGIGGGGLTSLATIAMSDLVLLRERGLFQGIGNLFYGLGAASGGVIGGLIADRWGWRVVFVCQVPILAVGATLVYMFFSLPPGLAGLGDHSSGMRKKIDRIDFLGSLLMVLAVVAVMLAALLGGNELKYSSPAWLALCAALLVLLAAFLYVELYVLPEPVIPVRLMADRTVACLLFANWFQTMLLFSMLYYVPVYFLAVLGLLATQNGTRMIPNFVTSSAALLISGYYMKRTGRYYRYVAITGLIGVVGTFAMTQTGPNLLTFGQFLVFLAPGGLYSLTLTVTLLALIALVPMSAQAAVTLIQYAFRSTGSTLGVLVALAIFQQVLSARVRRNVEAVFAADPSLLDKYSLEHLVKNALESTEFGPTAPAPFREAIRMGYNAATHGAFWFAFGAMVCAYASILGMREQKLHTDFNRSGEDSEVTEV